MLRSQAHDQIVAKKDQLIDDLQMKMIPLKNFSDGLVEGVRALRGEVKELHREVEEKEQLKAKLELISHQYDQLKKLVFGRSSEKLPEAAIPEQLSLDVAAETVEACRSSRAVGLTATRNARRWTG